MLVEVDLRLMAKYLLYLDCVLVLLCAHLLFMKDVSEAQLSLPPHSQRTLARELSLLNARIFFFSSSAACALVFFYLLRPHHFLVLLFLVWMGLHLLSRLIFESYFYFFLHLPYILAIFLVLFYLYSLWQNIDTHYTVDVSGQCCAFQDQSPRSRRHRRRAHRRKRHNSKRSKDSFDDT